MRLYFLLLCVIVSSCEDITLGLKQSETKDVTVSSLPLITNTNVMSYPLNGKCLEGVDRVVINVNGNPNFADCVANEWDINLDLSPFSNGNIDMVFSAERNSVVTPVESASKLKNINFEPIISQSCSTNIAEDSAYSCSPVYSDLDGDSLTHSLDTTNTCSFISINSATGELVGTPQNADIGTCTLAFKSNDGTVDSNVESVSLTVSNINDAPVLSQSCATSINKDSAYSCTPTVNDVDAGDTQTFSLDTTNTCSFISINSSTGVVSGTPLNAHVGTCTLAFKSNDGTVDSNTIVIGITIESPMVSKWRVGDSSYGDGNNSVTLPLSPQYNYNMRVDWGDGSHSEITSHDDSDSTHNYLNAGDYTITVTGIAEAWNFEFSQDKEKIIAVSNLGDLGWIDLSNAFLGASRLTSFHGGKTSNVISMSNMFNGASSLTDLDISNFDTSNVTDMSGMFAGSSLTDLDLSNFDTSNVSDMSEMFVGSTVLTNLDLSSFNTSNVTDMSGMFLSMSYMNNLSLSNFDTSSVTDMSDMFGSMESLSSINLNNFNTSNVTDMSDMFHYSYSLSSLDLSNFDTSNVTDMSDMFNETYSLTALNISNFNTSKVTDMSSMFVNTALSSLQLSHFDTANVTDMSSMFASMQITSLDISNFDTSSVVNMSGMFGGIALTSLDLANFDTSNVTDMSGMFGGIALTSLDLANFNTSNVTDMSGMFSRIENIISLDLTSFNTSKVTDMSSMFGTSSFSYTSSLSSIINIENFDTSSVTNMSAMFAGIAVTSLDLSNFDTSNVTDMSNMFQRTRSLRSLNLSSFNTSNVTDMSRMFDSTFGTTLSFANLDLSNFVTSNVTDMTQMFRSSSVSTLDLSNFDTSNVTSMARMFEHASKLESLNANNWNIINVNDHTNIFDNVRSNFTIQCDQANGTIFGETCL